MQIEFFKLLAIFVIIIGLVLLKRGLGEAIAAAILLALSITAVSTGSFVLCMLPLVAVLLVQLGF